LRKTGRATSRCAQRGRTTCLLHRRTHRVSSVWLDTATLDGNHCAVMLAALMSLAYFKLSVFISASRVQCQHVVLVSEKYDGRKVAHRIERQPDEVGFHSEHGRSAQL